MRSPDEIDAVDWGSFAGPAWFRPAKIPKLLHGLASPQPPPEKRDFASDCLFAFGNHHAGTLYPVAPHVVPFLMWFVANGEQWASAVAFAVLDDAVACFAGEHGFVAEGGEPIELAFRRAVRADLDAMPRSNLPPAIYERLKTLQATLSEWDEP
jgi:hypothetical protein